MNTSPTMLSSRAVINYQKNRANVGAVATLSITHRMIIGIQIILQNKKVHSTATFVEKWN
jgi:hypothetical protein